VIDPTRGTLHPRRLPVLRRLPPAPAVADLVAWYWIPRWDLPRGRESRQQVLSYPAANLVVEGGAVTLVGATTRMTERVLAGRGWAVGALLRPAAFAALCAHPARLVDDAEELDAPELADAVVDAMPADEERAATILGEWIDGRVGSRTHEARQANAMAEVLMTDPAVLRVEDAAARLAMSSRTLQRLAHRTVGLPPAAIIRRRRLQEAAQRVREHPEVPLADVAAQLGYADQAHLANDFRTVLGFTPTDYRRAASDPGAD
jgi:AraC-like DNA-binding protein